MIVVLEPGDKLLVQYEGTDGEVEVRFLEEGTEVLVDGEQVHFDPFVEWDSD